MATLVVLASFTDQGVRNVKETIGRAEAFTALPSRIFIGRLAGTTSLRSARAPDDEAATALSLSVCSRGNVRPETLRAFSFDEMKKILGKMV
jgi:uncharacterized protein with GYD domain